MFRTLKRLFFLAFIVTVAAAAWLRNSPYWTFVEINNGIEHRDLARVERVMDLERFVASSTAATGALIGDQLGGNGPDAGGKLLGALAGAIGKGLGDLVAKDGAKALREAIVSGRVERKVGPLEVNQGVNAVGGLHKTIDGAVVEVKGACDGNPASLWLTLERREDGPFGGYPHRWVVVGIEAESLKDLAARCRAAPAKA